MNRPLLSRRDSMTYSTFPQPTEDGLSASSAAASSDVIPTVTAQKRFLPSALFLDLIDPVSRLSGASTISSIRYFASGIRQSMVQGLNRALSDWLPTLDQCEGWDIGHRDAILLLSEDDAEQYQALASDIGPPPISISEQDDATDVGPLVEWYHNYLEKGTPAPPEDESLGDAWKSVVDQRISAACEGFKEGLRTKKGRRG